MKRRWKYVRWSVTSGSSRMVTKLKSGRVVSTFQVARKHEVSDSETPVRISTELMLVSLARAVYSRASILFLDDVLSAGEFYFVQ